jgi:D-inositol-3-phosphate glycosyltransferase
VKTEAIDSSVLPQRIAVVSYHTCPLEQPGKGDSGGLNVFVLNLAQEIARRGLKVDIYTRRSAPDSPHVVISGPGVRVIHIDAGPPTTLSKRELVEYIEEFGSGAAEYAARCSLGYDVVHSHYWMSGPAAQVMAANHRSPHIHTSHTLQAAKDGSGADSGEGVSLLRRSTEKELLNSVDLVTASTEYESAILRREYGVPSDRVFMLPPGFDPMVFSPSGPLPNSEFLEANPKIASLLLEERPIIVAAGRIQPLKGFDLAVEAVEQMRCMFPRLSDCGLLICGGPSGEDGESEVEKLTELISKCVRPSDTVLAGPVGRRDLATILRRADLLLITSRTESFGMIALESLACGTPVVATTSGGVDELIKDGLSGALVESRDPVTLGQVLGELLERRDRLAEMGVAAATSVREMTWDRVAEDMMSAYSGLLDPATADGVM